ncbi:MAG TPA: N-acetylmuramoyl-L-alanine amidase [Gaiellaceae bacterium]|nr:N-acetylmuramoyl-L-alanine amidase [Gaiellaceae bacterium]
MSLARLSILAAAIAASSFLVPAAQAGAAARPPVMWLKGEGNFTKAHRPVGSIESIVVHVTEGAFWGSVQWLKSPRAHASSHYVVSRSGRIVQLVHLSDVAWHAGNWRVNTESVGIEHEGFTYAPGSFTNAQYHASARLAAWIARRSLMPIDRRHFIGHADVPAPGGGRGGSSHHTDPGPHWKWDYYLRLVRRYAGAAPKLSVLPVVPAGPLRGIVPWRAKATGDIGRVEFSIDGRVVRVDGRAPFALTGGLNTAKLGNGTHVLQVHGIAGPGRYDIARKTIVVENKPFALTSAGARPWTKVRGTVKLRVRPWGAKAASMTFLVDGRRRAVDRRPPFLFAWNAARAKPGKHVLEVVATSVDGRVAKRRIPLVAAKRVVVKPKPPVTPPLRIVTQSVAEGQEVTGLVIWRVEVSGKPSRVEFLIDGVIRGADVAAPYTFGWNSDAEAPGTHRLTARAVGRKTAEATAAVTIAPR